MEFRFQNIHKWRIQMPSSSLSTIRAEAKAAAAVTTAVVKLKSKETGSGFCQHVCIYTEYVILFHLDLITCNFFYLAIQILLSSL